MKKLLFGWVSKKIFELTLIDYFVFLVEFSIVILLLSLLTGFIICKIDNINFKKKWGIK